jgi:hypothetical protein
MEEDLTGERVESVEELSEGDTVYVSGNGTNIAAEVASMGVTSWMTGGESDGTLVADLEMSEGYRETLRDSEPHPLQTQPFEGINSRQGPVRVERVNDE